MRNRLLRRVVTAILLKGCPKCIAALGPAERFVASQHDRYNVRGPAKVAELVDALDLGSSG